MRSWDCASAGDWGRVLVTLEARVVAIELDMLIKTGEEGSTALRAMGVGDSTTLGRLRFTMGVVTP